MSCTARDYDSLSFGERRSPSQLRHWNCLRRQHLMRWYGGLETLVESGSFRIMKVECRMQQPRSMHRNCLCSVPLFNVAVPSGSGRRKSL